MANGCYDLDGKCTVCGEYHPCSCEANNESEETQKDERCSQCGQTSHEDSFGHCPEASSKNSEPEWDDGNQQDER